MSLNSVSDFDNLGLCFFSSPTVDTVNPGNGRRDNDNYYYDILIELSMQKWLLPYVERTHIDIFFLEKSEGVWRVSLWRVAAWRVPVWRVPV